MKSRDGELRLFEEPTDWEKEWENMPEFNQKNRESIAHVVIHFETQEDMAAFSQLIGFTVTKKTRGLFFPVKKRDTNYVYADKESL